MVDRCHCGMIPPISGQSHPRRHAPDVIAGEVYVLPAERREMDEQLVRNLLGLA